MDYQMLVLDLDGTLTNSRKELTEPTKQALIEIQEEGKKVVLASGRPINGIVPLAWSLDACGPITRSIRDNALMLGVLAGEEPGDPSTAKRPGDDFSRTIDRGRPYQGT